MSRHSEPAVWVRRVRDGIPFLEPHCTKHPSCYAELSLLLQSRQARLVDIPVVTSKVNKLLTYSFDEQLLERIKRAPRRKKDGEED